MLALDIFEFAGFSGSQIDLMSTGKLGFCTQGTGCVQTFFVHGPQSPLLARDSTFALTLTLYYEFSF